MSFGPSGPAVGDRIDIGADLESGLVSEQPRGEELVVAGVDLPEGSEDGKPNRIGIGNGIGSDSDADAGTDADQRSQA